MEELKEKKKIEERRDEKASLFKSERQLTLTPQGSLCKLPQNLEFSKPCTLCHFREGSSFICSLKSCLQAPRRAGSSFQSWLHRSLEEQNLLHHRGEPQDHFLTENYWAATLRGPAKLGLAVIIPKMLQAHVFQVVSKDTN